ncbi:PAS domain S-box protein [Flaviramulus sp. BrNp1-15]|uniref:PAS domain S-box protein n=1 Tax=Flaviramulus sp. BrNp1-15 TaxID=2916754 RepID=UPI001EE9028A|nr:PAS domain S-box protein [Flaviramulus sp. BrNp1-15]ULC58055.1 PAS domain S-box protein [Flaviramulus sp. BrNp1-15]
MEAIKYYLSNNINDTVLSLFKENSIITVTDFLGRIEYASENYCKILECDVNKLIGETHGLLKSHLHSEKKYKQLWRTIKMGNKWNGVLSDRSQSGKMFWLDTTIIPIKDNTENTTKYVCIYNDVTENQSQNIKLIESNKINSKYKSIFQSVNVGIIVVADSKGNITEWNKGAELAFGYSKVEILGQPLTILTSKKFKKGNIKELLKAINRIKNNQNVDIIEMFCLRKNGEEFPVEFALSSLNVDDNCFYCAMMLDITKRKTLQNKLKQKTKDLELFLYRSAHDLKAPFSSAEGLINLLKDEKDGERIKFLVEMLETTIKSGKGLVDNLNRASIASSKKKETELINFSKIISNVLRMLSGTKNFGLFKFNINIDNSINYYSNPELLSSIFQNLIQNAIKYSVEPTNKCMPYVDVSVKSLKKGIVIKVCDNGQGISENCINKIFDLYYRANINEVPGNGLGLYIVKNIIEDLEGKINVTSNINKGTCFKVELPHNP